MFDQQTTSFASFFFRRYPGRTLLMVGLLILSGLAEGVGVITLLPVLELVAGAEGDQPSQLSLMVGEGLERVGLSPSLGILLGLIVVAMVGKGVLRWLAMRQVGYTVAQIATDLRLRLIRALMNARWSHFVSHSPGHFANAISTEAHRASGAYRQACAALAGVIQVGVYLAVVFVVSWQLALITILVGVLVVGLLQRFVAMSREAGRHQTQVMRRLVWRLTDALPGIKPVKVMARERHLLPLLEEETNKFNEAQRKQVSASESMRAFQEPILVVVIAIGLYIVIAWTALAFSAVLIMIFLFYRVIGQVNALQSKYQDIAVGESAFWSIHELISDAEAAEESNFGTHPPPELKEGIRFENVSFSYGDHSVLENASLLIPAGQFVALIGPSGAGKTTLADLSSGLHRPQEGEVYLDDIPLGEIDLSAWRERIGYVPQETLLFDGSIYRNVTLGDKSVSRTEVQRALEAAGAWDFVSQLKGGMDRDIGQLGGRLSGGQRQRISIARALLGKPTMLILDEATTALDPLTEAGICETLRKLPGDVTILAISHQAALRDAADVVFEVAEGRVERTKAPGAIGSQVGEVV
ncbi:MAG: ABC transporter ATP-binding protein [Gemmatimonadota bacterium]